MYGVNAELRVFYKNQVITQKNDPDEKPSAELLRPGQAVEKQAAPGDLSQVYQCEESSYEKEKALDKFLDVITYLHKCF